MATAQILINGSSSAVTNLVIGDVVALSNFDNTGVSDWQWSFIDRPTGSTATLSTPTASTSSFTVDKEGSYLISLTINTGESTDTSIAAALSSLSGLRWPAAEERTEVNLSRGWAESLNATQLQLEKETRAGGILTCDTSEAIAIGTPVRVTGTTLLADGSRIPVVGIANASSILSLPVIGIAASVSTAPGNIIKVRTSGIFAEGTFDTSAGAVGDPVYVDDSGVVSLTSGTIGYVVGYIASVGASGRIFSSSSGSIGIGGVGTANRVAYWNSASSLTASDNFYFNGTNIGVGNTNPQSQFHLRTSPHLSGFGSGFWSGVHLTSGNIFGSLPHVHIVTENGGSDKPMLWLSNEEGVRGFLHGRGNSGADDFFIGSVGSMGFYTGASVGAATRKISLSQSGNLDVDEGSHTLYVDATNHRVGLGTNSPTERLHVSGNVRFSGALMPNNTAGTAGQILTSAGAGSPPTWTSGGSIALATTTTSGLMPTTVFQQLSETESDGFLTGGVPSVSGSNVNIAAFTLVSNGDKFITTGVTTVPIPDGTDQYVYWDGSTNAMTVGTAAQATYTAGNVPVCYIYDVTGGVISGFSTDPLSDIRRFVNKGQNKVVLTIGAQPTGSDLGHADFYSLQGAVDWAIAARASGFWKMIEFRLVDSVTLTDSVYLKTLNNVKFTSIAAHADATSGGLSATSPTIFQSVTNTPIFDLSAGNSNIIFDNLHFSATVTTIVVPSIFYMSGPGTIGITITNCTTEPSFGVTASDLLQICSLIEATSGDHRFVRLENNHTHTSMYVINANNAGTNAAWQDAVIVNNKFMNNGHGTASGGTLVGYRGLTFAGLVNSRIEGNTFGKVSINTGFRQAIHVDGVNATNTVIANNNIVYDGTNATSQLDTAAISIGVRVGGSSGDTCSVQHNMINLSTPSMSASNIGHAIFAANINNMLVSDNLIANNIVGVDSAQNSADIYLFQCNDSVISGNTTDHVGTLGYCIYVNGNNSLISNNSAHVSTASVNFTACIQGGTVTSNNSVSGSGTHLSDSTHGFGIYSSGVVTGNTISQCARGLSTGGEYGVANNVIDAFLVGISVTSSGGTSITGNVIKDSSDGTPSFTTGIDVASGLSDVIINGNAINGLFSATAYGTGINLNGATNITVVNNRIRNCVNGIDAAGGTGMMTSNNAISCTNEYVNIGAMDNTGNM